MSTSELELEQLISQGETLTVEFQEAFAADLRGNRAVLQGES